MTPREVGLGLQGDRPPEEYARLGRLAEEGGFDVVSVFNDLWYRPAIVPLLLLAQATQRVRLGPAALNPFTLHPVEIAGQIASLDAVRPFLADVTRQCVESRLKLSDLHSANGDKRLEGGEPISGRVAF